MADITDEVLHVLVGAREAGVSRQECHDLVRDVYAAPWERQAAPVSLARRLIESIFATPHVGRGGAVMNAE